MTRRLNVIVIVVATTLGVLASGVPHAGAAPPTISEFPLPTAGSRPIAITTGPDGALWFTEDGTDRIGRMDTTGRVTEFPLTAGSDPLGITAGPDGALWFTEFSRDRIGRITTSGQITEFPVTPFAAPFRIVAGPDGNLWFTETRLNRVGRMDTSGHFVEFPLILNLDTAQDITVGPDGNLWVTEFPEPNGFQHGGLVQVRTDGTQTAVETTLIALPFGIATGSDGKLWVTDPGIDHVASFDLATHRIRTFTVPGGIQNTPYLIVSGPDGALWLTENGSGADAAPLNVGGNKLGRIVPSRNVLAQLTVPTASSAPAGITVGPDGAIWFAETDGNRIGRVAVPG